MPKVETDILSQDGQVRLAVVLVLVFSLIPLLVTPVLPLTDFYAHVARYYVLANLAESPTLQESYETAWQLLPNLGLDVLGVFLMKALPPLMVAKLIAGLIIAAPMVGVLYLAHVLHGRVSVLHVLLAGLVAYNHILIWGFSNFLLGLGVLLGATGYWIAACDRPGRQLAVTVCLGLILFFIHGLAFALWGLLLGAVELSLARQAGQTSLSELARRAGRLLLIAVAPVILFLQTKTVGGGAATAFSNFVTHAEQGTLATRLGTEVSLRAEGILRVVESTSRTADYGLGALVWATLAIGLLAGIWQVDKRMRLAIALCIVLVVITPPNLFGVGHLSERIPLLLLTLLAANLSLETQALKKYQHTALLVLAALLLVRNLILSVSWYQDGLVYSSYLDAMRQHDTRNLGAGVYLEGTEDPGAVAPSCMPLPFLMTFNGTAVPTFANPTQQPLRIIGNLRDVQTTIRQINSQVGQTVSSALSVLAAAKTDTVVVCSTASFAAEIQGYEIISATAPWTLYQRAAAQ